MGDHGLASRVLSTRIGNRWTYAGDNVAPGQVSAQRMLDEFRFHDLRPGTAVYGVVGNPVMHSLSPVMHNAGFRHFGIDAVYLPLLAKDATDFVAFARALGLAGASITAPFKVHLMESVDELEPLAQRVGAINTLTVRDGRWLGANTDVYGFAAPLDSEARGEPSGLKPEATKIRENFSVASGFSRKASRRPPHRRSLPRAGRLAPSLSPLPTLAQT